jgi:hypothetical protein
MHTKLVGIIDSSLWSVQKNIELTLLEPECFIIFLKLPYKPNDLSNYWSCYLLLELNLRWSLVVHTDLIESLTLFI